MKALVIGGAGFIGSHTVDALIEKGYEVKILDNLQKPVHKNGVPKYLNPKAALEQLASKLKTLGLEMTIPEMSGNGSVNIEVNQFGGRFGKDIDGSDIKDDGISHKKEGGLKLNVKYETLENGSSNKISFGEGASARAKATRCF